MPASGVDVLLVHPPSIYDFRRRPLKPGPISDVVPSTPVFEMYPIGFVSMLSYLVKHGYRARIANIAVLMLSDNRFDPVKYLGNIDAEVYGVDLHWMPHVHGAYNISRMIKELHPNSKVVLGGYSSTYYADEIMKEWPWVDYILCGDYQEDPLMKLTGAVETGGNLDGIPGLIYRDGSGMVRKNGQEIGPEAIKRVFFDYKVLASNTIKYHDIRGHLPYYSWINNPEGFTLIEHGCGFNCGFCGGSNFAYRKWYGSVAPLYRDPETVVSEMELVEETIGGPVFIAGDINDAGEAYSGKFFRSMREHGLDLPLLTEFFVPPGREYLERLSRNVPDYTAEISPESSNETIRKKTGKSYSNSSLEKSISDAKELGCRKFDVYFTIGLPGQDRDDVFSDAEYSGNLMQKFGKGAMGIHSFISPLTPFLDPGSLMFEFPQKYGYNIYFRQLKDFYTALDTGRSWEEYLNCDNGVMSRKQLVETTYLAGIRMLDLKKRMGMISDRVAEAQTGNILNYLNGREYEPGNDPSKHLTYIEKEIEWSKSHRLTPISFLVLLYKFYYDIYKLMRS